MSWRMLLLLPAVFLGCGQRQEGLDPSKLPAPVRADYEVFAQRCSKCHTLQRPLNAQVEDDEAWSLYVARMRRMPGSAISEEDVAPILRFLHYYSAERARKPAPPADAGASLPDAAPLPAPLPEAGP